MSNRYKYIDENKEHLHTLDGKPLLGTSTAMGVLAKVLTWWASGMAVGKLGWLHPKPKVNGKYKTTPKEERIAFAQPVLDRIKLADVEEYIAMLDEAYKAHSVKLTDSAQAGTDMHAELEAYVKASIRQQGGKPLTFEEFAPLAPHKAVEIFAKWAVEKVERFIWSEAHCYSEVMWCGGISDVGAEMKSGDIAIIDFKSSKEAYASQFFQIAGYDLEISENGLLSPNGDLIMRLDKEITQHIVFPFGAEEPEAQVSTNVLTNREAFKHCIALYKIMKNLGEI